MFQSCLPQRRQPGKNISQRKYVLLGPEEFSPFPDIAYYWTFPQQPVKWLWWNTDLPPLQNVWITIHTITLNGLLLFFKEDVYSLVKMLKRQDKRAAHWDHRRLWIKSLSRPFERLLVLSRPFQISPLFLGLVGHAFHQSDHLFLRSWTCLAVDPMAWRGEEKEWRGDPHIMERRRTGDPTSWRGGEVVETPHHGE